MARIDFEDYYKILQVHYDAAPEVIKAAYRRLSVMYHPDSSHNQNEDSRMLSINRAYEVLSDVDRRRQYHKQWLEHYSNRNAFVKPESAVKVNASDASISSAEEAIDAFFHSLKTKNWEAAYLRLTEEDKEKVAIEEFIKWKEAVSVCYEMQNYKIRFFCSYYNCRIGEAVYNRIMEFAVSVEDVDTLTLETSTEILHKYVAYDGVSWKVCLGMSSLRQSTLRFQLMAERRKNFDPIIAYRSAVKRTDTLTGLLSEEGFFAEGEKEIYRNRRYGSVFSILAFRTVCVKKEDETASFCHLAQFLHRNSRLIDIFGVSKNYIVAILPETDNAAAAAAVEKFVRMVKEQQTFEYDIFSGIVDGEEYSNIEDAVFAACSASNHQSDTIWFSTAEQSAG